MAHGPAAALPIVDELVAAGALPGSHLLPSVRGELLARLGRDDEARAELERAAGAVRQRARARGAAAQDHVYRAAAVRPARNAGDGPG